MKGFEDVLRRRVGIRVRIPAGKVVRIRSGGRIALVLRRCGGGAGKLGFVGFTRRRWMGFLVASVVVGTNETMQPRAAHECRFGVPVLLYIRLCGATALETPRPKGPSLLQRLCKIRGI